VRGIKEAKAARLSEAGLTVNGAAFHASAAKADKSAKPKKLGKDDGADPTLAKK
jgi:hypothetical protein